MLKTANQSSVDAGDPIIFTITVRNIGAGQAKNVTLVDTLPSGITWAEDSSFCSISSGVLSCNFGGLASNATQVVHVSGTTTATNCGVVTNTATVAASNEDMIFEHDRTRRVEIP